MIMKTLSEQIYRMNELAGVIVEANKTPCQTPDSTFHTEVKDNKITCSVDLPMDLNLSPADAKILETNIHNAMELVLAPYFKK